MIALVLFSLGTDEEKVDVHDSKREAKGNATGRMRRATTPLTHGKERQFLWQT